MAGARTSGVGGELRAFRKLADAIGLEAALLLRAWSGGQQLSIPRRFDAGHLLCRLIGPEAFRRLIENYTGEGCIHIPAVDLAAVRRAAVVHRLTAAGLGAKPISIFAGCTDRQVQRLQSHLRGTGRLFGLDDADADPDAETSPAPERQQAAKPAPPTPAGDVLAQLRAARRHHAAKERDYAD